MTSNLTQATAIEAVSVTIPSTAATIWSLVVAGGIATSRKGQCMGGVIRGVKTTGSNRGILRWGQTSGTQTGYVVAGADFAPPVVNFPDIYVKTASGTDADTVVELYFNTNATSA